MVAELWQSQVRIIDLSADFRLRDVEAWERWYNQPHACPELVAEAVYGLPEKYRADLAGARPVACAGRYPTAVQPGCWPDEPSFSTSPSTCGRCRVDLRQWRRHVPTRPHQQPLTFPS